jgi:hypothetical protein
MKIINIKGDKIMKKLFKIILIAVIMIGIVRFVGGRHSSTEIEEVPTTVGYTVSIDDLNSYLSCKYGISVSTEIIKVEDGVIYYEASSEDYGVHYKSSVLSSAVWDATHIETGLDF